MGTEPEPTGRYHDRDPRTFEDCGGEFWMLERRPYVLDPVTRNEVVPSEGERTYYVCDRCRLGFDKLVPV